MVLNRSEIDGFVILEGFQMVQEGRSSSLTKYEPVSSHEDPLYNDANIYTTSGIPSGSSSKDYIEVTVVDDDIADLVVLCGDNAGCTGDDLDVTGSRVAAFVDSCSEATTASDCLALSGCVWTGVVCAVDYEDDEVFIGSYDDSHPSNRCAQPCAELL